MACSSLDSFGIRFPIVLVTIILGCCLLTEQHCISDLHTDGCSIPFNCSFPYRRIFRPACIRHDVCYFCGTVQKWTRKECDKGFLQDMFAECEMESTRKRNLLEGQLHFREKSTRIDIARSVATLPNVKRFMTICKWTAHLYYWSVRRFAQSHFEETSPKWCGKPCAIAQGTPNIDKYNMAVE